MLNSQVILDSKAECCWLVFLPTFQYGSLVWDRLTMRWTLLISPFLQLITLKLHIITLTHYIHMGEPNINSLTMRPSHLRICVFSLPFHSSWLLFSYQFFWSTFEKTFWDKCCHSKNIIIHDFLYTFYRDQGYKGDLKHLMRVEVLRSYGRFG